MGTVPRFAHTERGIKSTSYGRRYVTPPRVDHMKSSAWRAVTDVDERKGQLPLRTTAPLLPTVGPTERSEEPQYTRTRKAVPVMLHRYHSPRSRDGVPTPSRLIAHAMLKNGQGVTRAIERQLLGSPATGTQEDAQTGKPDLPREGDLRSTERTQAPTRSARPASRLGEEPLRPHATTEYSNPAITRPSPRGGHRCRRRANADPDTQLRPQRLRPILSKPLLVEPGASA
ncbi:hypothetical protein BD413DRAFT_205303 [Trametes elegans]|nr:hypothetical protein BD413DRAFT_205303 [Trametes elegans]